MKEFQNNILTDTQIVDLAISTKFITPFSEDSLSGCSYDLHVGSILISRNRTAQFDLGQNSYDIETSECVTIETLEEISFRDINIFGVIANKHSILGQGLFHPITTVDPGFKGKLAITFIHLGHIPFRIQKGDRICKIYFHPVGTAVQRQYGSTQSPSYKEGSTEFALIIKKPIGKSLDSKELKYGNPYAELYKKLEYIETLCDKLKGEAELISYKKGEEKKKTRKDWVRWVIPILLTILNLLLAYVYFGGYSLHKSKLQTPTPTDSSRRINISNTR